MMKQDEMTQQELIAYALQDDTAELNELQQLLQTELEKPVEEQDTEMIREITQAICELTGEEASIGAYKAECVAEVNAIYKRRKIRMLKPLVACCAGVVLLLGLNSGVQMTFGMNLISAVQHFVKGSVSVQLDSQTVIELPTSADDVYGMKAKCEEYGFTPLTPTYLPEGFTLQHLSENESSKSSKVRFYYKNDDIILNFHFSHYNAAADIPLVSIPTDTYEVEKEEINGITILTLKEDNQFTAVFLYENIVYRVYAQDLNYDECYKIISSYAAAKE